MLSVLLVAWLASLAGAYTILPPLVKPIYDLSDAANIYKMFVKEHSKVYGADEYKLRFEIFKERLRRVNELNEKYKHTAFTIYHFADLTEEEINSYKGFNLSGSSGAVPPPVLPPGDAPEAFDWRDHGAVTPIKNQLNCGSCYIFSTIGNIEGQLAITHNKSVSLSEQQCLDCLQNDGCAGGIMDQVMKDLMHDKAGCMAESDYPYEMVKSTCREDAAKKVVQVSGGKEIHIENEDVLLNLLYKYGPLAVAMDAFDLLSYGGGILTPNICTNQLDHALTLVGYGVENGVKFWIIKNSWGTTWGEGGYLRLLRGVNACSMGTGYTAISTVV